MPETFAYFLVEDPNTTALPLPVSASDRIAVVRGSAPNELTYYASALGVGGVPVLQIGAPVSGSTIVMDASAKALYVPNATTLAALTVRLPAVGDDGTLVEICFAHAVTVLTIQDAAAVTVPTAPVSGAGPGAAIQMRFINSVTGYVYWK